jgi:hypothetical protein
MLMDDGGRQVLVIDLETAFDIRTDTPTDY